MIVTEIRCDGCDVIGEMSRNPRRLHAHVLRDHLRKIGWLVGCPGGTDYCPKCHDGKRPK